MRARYHLIVLKSGTSAEPTLIASRTSSTDTLAKLALAPKEKAQRARFKEFWRKKNMLI